MISSPSRSARPRSLASSLVALPLVCLFLAAACGGSEETAGSNAAAAGASASNGGSAGTSGATGGTSKGGSAGAAGAAGAVGLGGASGSSAGGTSAAGKAGSAGAGSTAGGSAGATAGGSAGQSGAGGETQAQFCAGKGPPILSNNDGKQICAGALAATTFRFGLCTCQGYVSSGKLTTDGFDSTKGAYIPGQNDGSVGTNAALNMSSTFTIGGSLWVAGDGGVTTSSNVSVGGDLKCGGEYVGQNLSIALDAAVDGKLLGKDVSITGTLLQPANAQLLVSGTKAIGAEKKGPVAFEDPCDCRPEQLVDIAGFVAARADNNDNASLPLAKDATTNLSADKTIELPCGRYYLDRLTGSGRVTFHAKGRVALFIGQDVSTSEGFAITTEPGAEVDLFIGGNVVSAGPVNLGDPAHPAAVRVYVGGSGTIALAGGGVFTGNLYAPKAEIVLAADTEIFGSVFARRVATSGDVTLHYDTAILGVGKDCPPPGGGGGAGSNGAGGDGAGGKGQAGQGTGGAAGKPAEGGCTSCRDCQNQACNAGVCGDCDDDGDCCAPLKCSGGICLPLIK